MTADGNSRNLVFCGVKHCGKSAMAGLAAKRFGLVFVDTDDVLLKSVSDESVRALYRRVGAEEFRRREAAVIADLAGLDGGPYAIALGGGVPANPFVGLELLKRLGTVIFLDLDVELAYRRIAAEGLPPFLIGCADPEAEFRRQCAARRAAYAAAADLTVRIACELPLEKTFELVRKELEK